MSLPRFFLEPKAWASSTPSLSADEAHHCAEVLRMRVGDAVVVFDGAGRAARAVLMQVGKKQVTVQLGENLPACPERVRITLAQAIPKGKTMEWIIEKATELGVAEIVPLVTDRTIVRLDAEESVRKQQKWQRVALEACKQCGQNWLPRVHPPQSLESWLEAGDLPEFRLIGALTADARPLQAWIQSEGEGAGSAGVLVGPEGDFSPQEMALALAAGFHPLAMGPIVLRAETAAIFGLSILTYELNAGR